jgi:hypothetical protein
MAVGKADRQRTGYKYQIMEKALWSLHGVPAKGIGAFRAQIRHLRNIGVPKLSTPGSGHKLDYSFAQVAEITMALALESLGIKPATVAELACAAAEHGVKECKEPHCYALIMQNDETNLLVFEHDQLRLFDSLDQLHCVLIMNVAKAVRDLDAALMREMTA